VLCRIWCALLFMAWTAELPLEADVLLYCGHWRSPLQVLGPLFVSVPGVSLTPWQILVIVLAPFCLVWPGSFRKRPWAMDAAIVVSLASVAVTFFWGWLRGGSPYQAYYQLWRFLLALLVGLLVTSVIRNTSDLRALGLTVLTAALVRTILAIYFYWAIVHDRIVPPPPYMTTHDDTLLFIAGLVILGSWALARETVTSWLAAAALSMPILYAIVLNNRRLAWVALLFVVPVIYLMLPRGRLRRRVTRSVLVAAPILALYVAAGWGRAGAIFAPVRALSTAGSYSDSSALAREEEIRNLLYTMTEVGNPLLGAGWGVQYEKLTSVYANFGSEWWQYRYLPHNSLLGVAVFAGLVGIAGMWLVLPVAASLGMRGYAGSTRPVDRAAAMAAVGVLPAYGAQCYGDIGLQSLTCGLILGVALAVAGKVSALAAVPDAPRRTPRRPRAPQPVAPPGAWAERTPRPVGG
jgi:O-antigen ligase/polysaccharide polymerase Wzy-like membrane protein